MPENPKKLFTKKDCLFITNVLGHDYFRDTTLLEYIENPTQRYRLLTEKALFQAIQITTTLTPISTYLYYAIQVSQILEQSGIHEHKMAESLSLSLAKVAQSLQKNLTTNSLNDSLHIPLMMIVAIKDKGAHKKEFQILGDLKKACVVIEGILSEKAILSKTKTPWV